MGNAQKVTMTIFLLGILLFALSFPLAFIHPAYAKLDFKGVHPSAITFCFALILIGLAFIIQFIIYRKGLSELLVGISLSGCGSAFFLLIFTLTQNPNANVMAFAALFFVSIIIGIAAALVK